jgi:signal transduction histidine kinase
MGSQMKPSIQFNLKARLYALTLLSLIPALLLIFFGVVEQRNSATAKILTHAYHLAKTAAIREEHLLQYVRQDLSGIADFYSLIGDAADPNKMELFLTRMMARSPGYLNIGVVQPDGKHFISAKTLPADTDFSERNWFKRTMASKDLSLGNYHFEQAGEVPVVVTAEPVVGPSMKVTAVVFAELNLAWLNHSLFEEGLELPAGSTLTQFDPSGSVLSFDTESQTWLTTDPMAPEVVQTIREQGRGVVEGTGPDGVARIYAFAKLSGPLQERRLYFALAIPRIKAFAEANRILIRNLGLLGIMSLLVLVTVRFVGELFVLKRINAMLHAAHRLKGGDLSARIGILGGKDELSRLAKVFDEMAATIEQRMQKEKETKERIRRSRQRLRQLAAHLQDIREKERTRIAREIHDHFGQSLSVLKMDLSWLKKRIPEIQSDLHEKLASMAAIIDATLHIVHEVCAELRPVILDDFGLGAAIEWQAQEFGKRSGIACEVFADTGEIDLNKDQATAMFRIFQETLTNIVRHAQATQVAVRLAKENDQVVLSVEDNGRGISDDEIENSNSFGLIGIRERLYPWNGEVRFIGFAGKGTLVIVKIPHNNGRPKRG